MALLTYDWRAPDPTGAVNAYLSGVRLGQADVDAQQQAHLAEEKMALEQKNQERFMQNMALQIAQEARLERADAIRTEFARNKDTRDAAYNSARIKQMAPTTFEPLPTRGGGGGHAAVVAAPAASDPASQILQQDPMLPSPDTIASGGSAAPVEMPPAAAALPGAAPVAPVPPAAAAALPTPAPAVALDPASSLIPNPPGNPLTDDVIANLNELGKRDPKAASRALQQIVTAQAKGNIPKAGTPGTAGYDPKQAIAEATKGMDYHVDGDFFQKPDGSKWKVRTYANGRAGLMSFRPDVKAAKILWGSDGERYPHDSQGNPLTPVPPGVKLREHSNFETRQVEGVGTVVVNPDGTTNTLIPEGIKMPEKLKLEYHDATQAVRDAQENLALQKQHSAEKPWFGVGSAANVKEAEDKLQAALKKAAGFHDDFPQLTPKAAGAPVNAPTEQVFPNEQAAKAAGKKAGDVIMVINPATGKPARARIDG